MKIDNSRQIRSLDDIFNDPAADELRNKNLNQQSPDMMAPEDQMYEDPAAYEEGYEDPEAYDDSGQY